MLRESLEPQAHQGDGTPDVSPAAVARQETPATERDPVEGAPADRHTGVARKWWFWTLIGVALAGAVAGVVVAASGTRYPPYEVGDEGSLAITLSKSAP